MQDGVVQKAKCVLSIGLSKSSWIFENVVSENCSYLNKKKAKNAIFFRPVNSKITTEKKNERKNGECRRREGRKEREKSSWADSSAATLFYIQTQISPQSAISEFPMGPCFKTRVGAQPLMWK